MVALQCQPKEVNNTPPFSKTKQNIRNMESLFNFFALLAFNIIAKVKGYTFKKVTTDNRDAQLIYDEEGFSFPAELEVDIQRFKAGTLNFVAYHKGVPAGL